MPPKKNKKTEEKGKGNKSKTDVNDKDGKKKKISGKGMGGTIGLTEKEVKKCILPCVKSFTQPLSCCPQEIRCPMPVCCTPAPICLMTICPSSTPCCYLP